MRPLPAAAPDLSKSARRAWLSALGMTGLALLFGTDLFSRANTAPILQWLADLFGLAEIFQIGPEPTLEEGCLRKTAHFLVYATLAALWHRAFRQILPRVPGWRLVLVVWGIAVAVASLDEVQQGFLSRQRTGSIWDVLLDSAGAAAALLIIMTLDRKRN
jgi:VanZ family protein